MPPRVCDIINIHKNRYISVMLASFNLTDSRPFVCGKGQKLNDKECKSKNISNENARFHLYRSLGTVPYMKLIPSLPQIQILPMFVGIGID